MKDGLEKLDPRDRAAVADVARLHGELLPGSPISRLGPDFMQRFYYRKLVEDGLVCCSIYYCDGAAAGFIAYTQYGTTFMSEGLRRHLLYLGAVMAVSVLRSPRRLATILWTLNHMRTQQGGQRPALASELLSFGVLPQFRTAKYIRETGRRISMALYDSACDYFRSHGIRTFRAMVEKSNREALLFYRSLDCEFDPGAEGKSVEVIGVVD